MADVRNVLVFPAGTEIAFEIHDALRTSRFVKLFGGTSVDCHADLVYKNCIGGFPFADEPGFTDYMNDVCDRYHIDYIYPAHDSALLALTQLRGRLHAQVVTSAEETVSICRSKNKTYEFLSGAAYLPEFYSGADDVREYPVFIKPSVGQGSQGARRIDDEAHLREALADGTEYAICEYLPGEECTVDCFTDRHGELRFVNQRSRDRIRAGIAVRSRVLPLEESVREIAEDLNRRFSFNGAWFFQVKRSRNGSFRLMEAAPRIAGTMCVSRNLGVNMPLLTLYNMWGYDVDIICNENAELMDRAFIGRFRTDIAYDNVYADFDDTIIIDGKVNTQMISFLYQARNAGKNLILLTKHSTDIHEDLKKWRISEALFDEVISIGNDEQKYTFIRENSIFIDDSFSERRRVRDALGIPVFSPDMIESLLDWRA